MNTVKRTLAILLAVCMVFALAIPAYAADDHTHEYTKTVLKAPTCTANGVAKFVCACGDLYYASIPAAHAEPGEDAEIVEPTCAKDGSLTYVCSGCGETISTVLPATGKHNYQETVCDATCTDPQRVGSFCSVCGKENPDSPSQELAPALGHDFTVEKEAVAPGCTEAGYTVYKCSRCDETKKVEVPAVGHKWNNGEVVDASCEAGEGVKYTCTVCGATRVEELPGDVGKPATGHTRGEYISDNAGKHTRTCEVCGKTETGDCAYDSVLTAATHTDHAYTTYTCSVCGYSYKEIDETSALDPNHTYIQSVIKPATCTTAGVAKLVCSAGDGAVNGYQSIPASHTWDDGEVTKAATCTEAGEMTFVCTVCKEAKTEVTPAAGHKFTWVTLPGDEPTCGTPGKKHQECTVCDYAEEPVAIEPTGEHTFVDKLVDADCTNPDRVGSFCSVCGMAEPGKEVTEVGKPLGHSYTEEITTEPTCDEKGVKTFTCSRCGDSKTEEIAALGHDYQSTGMEEATCEEPAYDVQECTRCGKKQKTVINGEDGQPLYPALEHDFVEDTVVEPTCTEEGYTVYKCSHCGKTKHDNIVPTTQTHTAEIVTVLRAATCTTNGVGKTACKYCGKAMGYQSIPASHKWDDGEVTKAATCTEAGEMTFVCTVCKEAKTEVIPAAGHKLTWVTLPGDEPTCGTPGKQHQECTVCDYAEEPVEIPATGEHTFVDKLVDADCTHPDRVGSFCSVCGAADPDKEVTEVGTALGHSYTEEITTKPTCDEKGVKTFTCSRCGDSKTEEIAALGHDYQSTGMEEATCEEPAYDVQECTRCGDVQKIEITGEAAQPALGHDFVKDTVVEPTCTEDGYTVYKCSRCGKTENRNVVTTTGAHTAEIVTVLREATCTTNGVGKTACKYCGKAMGYQSIPASHKWDDGEVTKAATCTEAGEMTFVCSVCKATKTEEIQALGHDIVFITDAEPTCGKAGEGHNECLTCGYKEDAQEIPATGEHTFVDKLVDADCTHPDRVGSFCSVCGAAEPGKEVTEVGTALGHSYTEEITTKPTCDEKGVKTFTCSRCGVSYTEEIAALGHDYQSTGMEDATCTAPAYDVEECTRCGDVRKTEITGEAAQPALGHDFVKDTVVEPTCTEDGYTVYKCSRCGKTENRDVVTTTGAHTAEIVTVLRTATCSATGVGKAVCKYCKTSMGYVVIPMAAHTYDDANSYVTEDQYLKVKCEVCGAEITLQDLNPCRNGHTWDEGEVTTEPTCTEKGVKTFTCTVKGCGATRTEDVEATGHDWQVVRDTEKEATCTEGGSCEYICSKCFETRTETTNALGHDYVDGVCSRCGESEPGQQPETPDKGGEEQG